MGKLSYIFCGATNFSKELLLELINHNFIPSAIFAIPKEFFIKYRGDGQIRKVVNYNYANLKEIASEYNIPCFEVDGSHGKKLLDYVEIIKGFSPQLMLCLGWYYLVPKKIREIPTMGAWGIHASLLPKYAGGAPLVWAIINGEKETGVTLFKFDDSVDGGDIIKQKKFSILFEDTIKEVYDKATKASKEMLVEVLANLDKVTFTPQDKSKIEVWSQRSSADGIIDWSRSVIDVFNFIRAQTKPYPGAYTFLGEKRMVIWRAYPFRNLMVSSNYKQIVSYLDRVGVQLKDGFLEIRNVQFDGKCWYFKDLVKIYNFLGKEIG